MKEGEFREETKKKDKSSIVRIGRVTGEEVMNMEEFEGISEEEAKEYISVLEQYCLLMCQFYIEVKEDEEDTKNIAA